MSTTRTDVAEALALAAQYRTAYAGAMRKPAFVRALLALAATVAEMRAERDAWRNTSEQNAIVLSAALESARALRARLAARAEVDAVKRAPKCECGPLHVAMHGGHDPRCPVVGAARRAAP